MSETVSRGPTANASSEDRIISVVNYVLLFLTPFFAGATALGALVLAYVRKGRADPMIHTHYVFQIRMFWIAVILLVVSIVMAFMGAGVLLTHLFEIKSRTGGGWDAWDISFEDGATTHLNLGAVAMLIGSGLLFCLDILWLMLASVFGVARLLTEEPIGRLPAR